MSIWIDAGVVVDIEVMMPDQSEGCTVGQRMELVRHRLFIAVDAAQHWNQERLPRVLSQWRPEK